MPWLKTPERSRQGIRQLVLASIPIALGPLGLNARLDLDIRPEALHKREDPSNSPNEELGHSTHDLHHIETQSKDRNGGKREDQGTVTNLPPEAPPSADGGEGPHDRWFRGSRVAKTDRRDTARGGITAVPDVAREIAGGFGPLKAVLDATSVTCGALTRKKIQNLCSRIITLKTIFGVPANDVVEERRRYNLLRKFESIEKGLWSLHEKPRLRGFALREDEEVHWLLEGLQDAISDYQMAQRMAIYDQELRVMNAVETIVLKDLCCADAGFQHVDHEGCLEGTRTTVLDKIEAWVGDFDEPPIYWLNGLAGTGKSAIAQTVAERLFAGGQLGASFFCSRNFEDRNKLGSIFPTIASQLAARYPEFRSILIPLMQAELGIAHESLHNQLTKLVVRPLAEAAISTVIVIDALDECGDEEPISVILSLLGRFVSQIPKVKFFITGRPDPHIMEGFRLLSLAKVTVESHLHDIDQCLVENDIRLFLNHKFQAPALRRRVPDDWPTEEHINTLCERAAGLFVCATATFKFVENRRHSPEGRLDLILRSPSDTAYEGKTNFKRGITLDSLYMSILCEAFGHDPRRDSQTRSILGAVTLAINPPSPSAIATLLGITYNEVFAQLTWFRSLLILHEDPKSPVRPFHKSFSDFTVDPGRCTNERFRISPPDHHRELLSCCLKLMNKTLEKNMCKLPDVVANREVKDLHERTERYIDPGLQYACNSWHRHLAEGHTDHHRPEIVSALQRFLEEKFLFWLEVLSVLGTAREAIDALEVAAKWLEESPTLDLVNDCSRFVTGFFEIINSSSPHIYHSALPLSPKESIVWRLYEPHARPLIKTVTFGHQA